MKNYNSLEKSHTVLFQVYAVGCTVTRSFPTGFRLKWLLQGSRLTGSFQGWCCSHLCYRLVAAESFLGASSWGREQRASRSHTHALDLADHPCSCCVVYINIYIYIYITLMASVYLCVCFKNHLFLTVISIVPWLLHWNHKVLLTTLHNPIQRFEASEG